MTSDDRGRDPESAARDGRLRALVEHSFDVIALLNRDATVEYVSPSIERVLGCRPDEFAGRAAFARVHPDDAEGVRGRFGAALGAPGTSLAFAARLRHEDGSWRRAEGRLTNLLEDPAVRGVVLNLRDVTDREIAEEQARRGQEELTDFIENATVAMHWIGPDGTILWANRAELDLLGYDCDEYVGRNIAEFHADPPVIEDILGRLARSEEIHSCEARLRCKDGSIRWVLISSNVLWRDGKFVHTRCFTRDITERKRLEQEFREQQEHWRLALGSIGDAVIATDSAGSVTLLNPVAESLCGVTRAEAVGRPLRDVFRIVNEQSRRPVQSPVEQVLATGLTVGLANHTVLLTPDGRETPIDDSAAPILTEAGRVAGVILVFRDVTEKRRAQELNERLAAIIESSDDIIASKTLDGILTSWNKGAERILGYTAEEVIGRHVSMLMPPEAIEDTEAILGRIRRGEKVDHYHTKRRRKDGRIVDVALTVSPIRNEEGEIVGASKVGRDISPQMRAQELNERLAAIVESSDDIIASKDLDGVLTSWNRGAERIFGYTAEEVIGRHVSMLMPPELVEDMPRILERIRRGEKVDHYETRRRRKDGTIIDVSLTVSPIRDPWGRIVGASKIGRDVTAEKRAREEHERLLKAAQAARADAEAANRMKDEFLAIISHELRTPLNAIVGWARILSSGPVDADDLAEGLATIDRNAKVQAQIVEDLLDVSRIISGSLRLDVQRVNLVEVIDAAIAAVTPAAEAKGVRLRKVLDPLAGPVSGDPARLQQIVWNLLSNAVKFTPKGGRVQVLLERVNSHVEVSVIDTGIGIRPEFLPHVFERFRQADSTTTRRHGGLGLGLAIVKQLTELQGGSVRAKSPGEGQGATFVVSLPITVVHEETRPPEQVPPKDQAAGEFDCSQKPLSGIRVLVVDDEPDARHLIRRVLADCHAEVALAASAGEAMRLLEGFRPDILVSDIGMPEQDGYDLIRQVRSRVAAKTLPAVALTAFARSDDRKRALLAGFQTHVAKPVDPAELVAVVASLVERTGGSP